MRVIASIPATIAALKAKLSIKRLKLERAGEEDEDEDHVRGKAQAISRLLRRILDGIEREEEDEDEDKDE